MEASMREQVVPEAVLAIAKKHVDGLRPVDGFVWCLARGRRVAAGWYFDYEVERLPTNPPSPGSGFGGAAGFLIADNGSVRVVSLPQLRDVLGLAQVE
jgi:hypothetical protein